ncbi:MAG: phospholipid-binding protein MlaC [Pseudobdellovibrionaceae bacterium]
MMMNLKLKQSAFSFATLLACACLSYPLSAQASALNGVAVEATNGHMLALQQVSTNNAAEDFVRRMAEDGTGFLADKSLSASQKSEKFSTLLNRNFDLDVIGKFSLGRYWKQMNPAQQKEYLKLFKKMVIGVYTRRFDDYQGQEVEVVGSTEIPGTKDTMVKSKIIQPDGTTPVEVDWRVSTKSGSPRIIDVLVAGVSMSVTQRSDFASVIQRGGGDVEVLLDHLRKK